MRFVAWIVICVLALTGPALADEACTLKRAASIDMATDAAGGATIVLTVAGKPLNLLIDTGGPISMLKASTVARLSLKTVQLPALRLQLIGGEKLDHFAIARDVAIGAMKAKEMSLIVMPDSYLPKDVDGVLGIDVLSSYEMDFDFANAKLGFFLRDHCAGQVVYWTQEPSGILSFKVTPEGHINVPIVMDGKEMMAMIDTGTSRTIMKTGSAKNFFGIEDANLKPGDDPDEKFSTYPFRSLQMGDVSVGNPNILLLPDEKWSFRGGPYVIIGMGLLRKLHLFVSYKEKKIYLTPAGAH